MVADLISKEKTNQKKRLAAILRENLMRRKKACQNYPDALITNDQKDA